MPAYPQQQQCERHTYRYFQQHDERLHKALELCRQDEIHQQNGNKQNNHQFVQHLPVGKETSGKGCIPIIGSICKFLHLLHQRFRLLHIIEAERYIFSITSGRDGLQIFRRHHRHQFAQGQIFNAFVVRPRRYQRFLQNVIHRLLLSYNADRQILLVRVKSSYTVFLESGFQDTVQFVIRHIVE